MGRDNTCGPWSTLANEFHANARMVLRLLMRMPLFVPTWKMGSRCRSGHERKCTFKREHLCSKCQGVKEWTADTQAWTRRNQFACKSDWRTREQWTYEIMRLIMWLPRILTAKPHFASFCYFQVYGIPGTTWDKQHGVIWQYRVALQISAQHRFFSRCFELVGIRRTTCDCLGTFDETGYNQMAPCSGLYWVCSGRR